MLSVPFMAQNALLCADVPLRNYRWAKKLDSFWELTTLQWLVVEMCLICQNLANFI